jgi:hypothetical protein
LCAGRGAVARSLVIATTTATDDQDGDREKGGNQHPFHDLAWTGEAPRLPPILARVGHEPIEDGSHHQVEARETVSVAGRGKGPGDAVQIDAVQCGAPTSPSGWRGVLGRFHAVSALYLVHGGCVQNVL